jgi:hypothetical protein
MSLQIGFCEEADMEIVSDRREIPNPRPMPIPEDVIVSAAEACPGCNERRQRYLYWLSMDKVRCLSCGAEYTLFADRTD